MTRLRSLAISALALGFVGGTPSVFVSSAVAQPYGDPYAAYLPRSARELADLAAPVALYPDAILAQVLTASTYPDDVIDAARWLRAGNDPNAIDSRNYDLSVKGVARYPGTLYYMADHADWMNDLGDAFLHQQQDVMSAVQDLRAQANAAGNLVSNSQQRVYLDGDNIEIVPADPQVIYVPQYDPGVVYLDRRYDRDNRWLPLETFGAGVIVGSWLHHDLDWRDRAVYVGDWGRDRPWWGHDADRNRDRGDGGRWYADNRPGTYRSSNVTNVRNTTIVNNRTDVRNNVTNVTNVQSNVWTRDAAKPAPRATRTATRTSAQQVGTGYPAAGRTPAASEVTRNVAIPQNTRGTAAVQASNRGQASRAAAQPAPVPAAAEPAARHTREATPAPAPAPAEPAARHTREATPAPTPAPQPAARPAPVARPAATPAPAPTRSTRSSSAASGYQSGAAAAASSQRGAASRGTPAPAPAAEPTRRAR